MECKIEGLTPKFPTEYGSYQRWNGEEWVDTGIRTEATFDSTGQVANFAPLSDADAEQLQKPYTNPEQPSRPSGPPGLEPPAVEGSGNMENPGSEVDTTGPEGFPADSGVPELGVVNSEGVDDVGAIPDSYVDTKHVIDMRGAPASSATNAAGFPRNGRWFWRQNLKENPSLFSDANKLRIRKGQAPVVDDAWVKNNPTHGAFKGDKLIHHHIDQGAYASGLPEKLHQQWDGPLHPNQ